MFMSEVSYVTGAPELFQLGGLFLALGPLVLVGGLIGAIVFYMSRFVRWD